MVVCICSAAPSQEPTTDSTLDANIWVGGRNGRVLEDSCCRRCCRSGRWGVSSPTGRNISVPAAAASPGASGCVSDDTDRDRAPEPPPCACVPACKALGGEIKTRARMERTVLFPRRQKQPNIFPVVSGSMDTICIRIERSSGLDSLGLYTMGRTAWKNGQNSSYVQAYIYVCSIVYIPRQPHNFRTARSATSRRCFFSLQVCAQPPLATNVHAGGYIFSRENKHPGRNVCGRNVCFHTRIYLHTR